MMMATGLKPHFSNYNSQEPFPRFQKPHIIDGFSLEQDRGFSKERRKFLKFWRRPQPGTFNYDLNLGYESYIPGPEDGSIATLLAFIEKNWKRLLNPSANRLAADFICYRGLLTQICISPYFTKDCWSLVATKYRGTIYLCNYVSPEQKRERASRDTEYSLRCCYYGKNFERFVLTTDPTIKDIPPPTESLNDTEEFNVALGTVLEGFRILYAAEMDGVDDLTQPVAEPQPDLNQLKFVEVKTRMRDTTDQQYKNFVKWKLPKWWCQSFLAGVDTIYSGYRTRDGFVQEIESLAVRQIPKMAHNVWSPAVMLRFGADFLSTVQDLMADVDWPETVFQFSYDSNKNWDVTYTELKGKNELSFLSQNHVELMRRISKDH